MLLAVDHPSSESITGCSAPPTDGSCPCVGCDDVPSAPSPILSLAWHVTYESLQQTCPEYQSWPNICPPHRGSTLVTALGTGKRPETSFLFTDSIVKGTLRTRERKEYVGIQQESRGSSSTTLLFIPGLVPATLVPLTWQTFPRTAEPRH